MQSPSAGLPLSSTPHVVVIGAGVGGLSAALELSGKGYEVTVFDLHEQPGGKMREVSIGQQTVDIGPTVFTMKWVFEELFQDCGLVLSDFVTLDQASVLARHSWVGGDSTLDLFADVDRSVEAISAFAGSKDADAYRRFAADTEKVFNTLDHSFMRAQRPGPVELTFSLGLSGVKKLYATKPFATLWEELGRVFDDQRLRQLFARYATYCGSSPFEAPATLMLIAHAERAGVWSVRGGMQRLAEGLMQAANGLGAEFCWSTGVTGVATEDQKVTGVVLTDGATVDCDAVIFNGDVQALGQGLLGDGVSQAIPRRQEPRSLSAITWAMTGTPKGVDLEHHTVFFGSDYADEFGCLFDEHRVCQEPTVYVCAKARSESKPTEPEPLMFLVNAPARAMEAAELNKIEVQVFDWLSNHGLVLKDRSDTVVRTTPNDFAQRFPGSDGAIYGWPTHGWQGSFKRWGNQTHVGGLILSGGTVHPGPGVPMTAISGRLAAARVDEYLS